MNEINAEQIANHIIVLNERAEGYEGSIPCSCGAARHSAACSLLPGHPHVMGATADDLCICGHARKWHGEPPFVGACDSGLVACSGKCSSYIKAPSAMQPGFMAPSERRR